MENKQMTAVEWLYEEIDNKDMGEIPIWVYQLLEQAKEMEKKQIIDAMDICQRTDFYVKYESSEQYYNETYKK